MKRNFNDLSNFIKIAREKSFTRTAAQLGVTQSALSQSIRNLEEQMGIRLLTRTTRSVSLTAAGEKLLESIGSYFDLVESELEGFKGSLDIPAGKVRITCGEAVVSQLLLPKLESVLKQYPDIKVEFDISYGFKDIVADRFDAGIRLGDTIDKDMVAVPIGPALQMAAVASPEYFSRNPEPKAPKELIHHNCINMRFPTHGNLYQWEFEKDGKEFTVSVDGQLTFNVSPAMVDAALAGLGIAFLPEEEFGDHIKNGRLIKVLEEWCPPFPGYYLYYPSRRQPTPAFAIVRDALMVSRDGSQD